MKHSCMWPRCNEQVSAALWGCRRHWFALPKEIRDRIYAAYRVGQTHLTMSEEYRDALVVAERWALAYERGRGADRPHDPRGICACGDRTLDGKATCGRVQCAPRVAVVTPRTLFTCARPGCGELVPYGYTHCGGERCKHGDGGAA